jgi:hypothetical protein
MMSSLVVVQASLVVLCAPQVALHHHHESTRAPHELAPRHILQLAIYVCTAHTRCVNKLPAAVGSGLTGKCLFSQALQIATARRVTRSGTSRSSGALVLGSHRFGALTHTHTRTDQISLDQEWAAPNINKRTRW